MRLLQIAENAYRATIEEQDDPILWLSHCLRTAGADVTLLLTGNAVNYTLVGQDASGLCFGTWRQTRPPNLSADLSALVESGVSVYAVAEDLETRGLLGVQRVPGVEVVARSELTRLFDQHDAVFHW